MRSLYADPKPIVQPSVNHALTDTKLLRGREKLRMGKPRKSPLRPSRSPVSRLSYPHGAASPERHARNAPFALGAGFGGRPGPPAARWDCQGTDTTLRTENWKQFSPRHRQVSKSH